MTTPSRDAVVAANVEVHTVLAHQYNEDEPHFRPENLAKVEGRLKELSESVGGGRLLDIGCGTGFTLALAVDHFDELHGVDATQAMLDRVDLSSGKVHVQQGLAEEVPFDDGSFDAVTAYSFLHHLLDHRPAFAEAFRVLRPGGRFYIDLEPNRRFWTAIRRASEMAGAGATLDPLVEREVGELLSIEDEMESLHGIDPETFRNAEFIKAGLDGFDPTEFADDLAAAGFVDVDVQFDWFLGQAAVMHGESFEAAQLMDSHLRRLLPTTDHLFKYLRATATKP